MTVAAQRAPLWLHPSLVVARFTLRSMLRRRWLTVAGGVGLLLLVIDGIYTKTSDHILSDSYAAQLPHHLASEVFLSSAALTAVIIGGVTLVVAMSIIRDDLGSGAGELLLTKPLPRAWYGVGKITTLVVTVVGVAALTALVRIAVLLLETNDSAYLADTLFDTLAIVANAFVFGLVVLAISSWGSSLAAGLFAAILLLLGTVTAPMMTAVANHSILDPEASLVSVAYDLSPRLLSSPHDSFMGNGASTCSNESGRTVCTFDSPPVAVTSGGSSAIDVLAWAGYSAGTIVIMLLGIRRFSGRHTE